MGLDDGDSLIQWYMSLFIMQSAADFTATAVCCLDPYFVLSLFVLAALLQLLPIKIKHRIHKS
jgi:hypothetical protein